MKHKRESFISRASKILYVDIFKIMLQISRMNFQSESFIFMLKKVIAKFQTCLYILNCKIQGTISCVYLGNPKNALAPSTIQIGPERSFTLPWVTKYLTQSQQCSRFRS